MKCSIVEESKLPTFKSHLEARIYFKELYGDNFLLADRQIINGNRVFFYVLIYDREKYNEMMYELQTRNLSEIPTDLFSCYQDVAIYEDGCIHISN